MHAHTQTYTLTAKDVRIKFFIQGTDGFSAPFVDWETISKQAYGTSALRKAYICSTLFLGSFADDTFEKVLMLVWWTMVMCYPFKVEHWPLIFFLFLSSSRSILGVFQALRYFCEIFSDLRWLEGGSCQLPSTFKHKSLIITEDISFF